MTAAVAGPSQLRSGRGSEYAELGRQVRAAGLLARRPWAYTVHVGGTITLFLAVCSLVAVLGDTWWQLVAAVGLGVAFTQAAFVGHDGGHQQIFATRRLNDLVGQLSGNLLVGLSYGWWVGKHNRHHANPNTEHRDPDIGDGVLAFTTDQVASRAGHLGRAIVRHQAWLFFPLLTLEGWNLHIASIRSLLPGGRRSQRGGARRTEIALLSAHVIVYVGGLLVVMSPIRALIFVLVHQAAFGLYMGCSFAPNHKGMRTIGVDEDVDFLRRQVLTSRNVRGGQVVDWLLGGLNYQIEHHLFPSMPRPSLGHARTVVRQYCAAQEITYTETTLLGSYRAALGHLHTLGAPLRTAADVP